MNTKTTKILFLALSVAALSSCSTAYKVGQTPDDVYYSPARQRAAASQDSYVETSPNQQRYSGARRSDRDESYQDFDSYRNDRFLRMSIGSPMRLSAFDDYYMYDGYSNWKYNNYAYNWNTPWNSYYYWNNYYNPYNTFNFYTPYYYSGYSGNVIVSPKATTINPTLRPRAFNPASYSNNNYNNNNLYLDRNSSVRPTTSSSGSRYNNGNSYYNNSNSGSTMRRLPSSSSSSGNTYYNNPSSSSNNSYSPPARSYDAPTRSYSPSSSGSSSSGSSSSGSSGGGGVSRPGRGGD